MSASIQMKFNDLVMINAHKRVALALKSNSQKLKKKNAKRKESGIFFKSCLSFLFIYILLHLAYLFAGAHV